MAFLDLDGKEMDDAVFTTLCRKGLMMGHRHVYGILLAWMRSAKEQGQPMSWLKLGDLFRKPLGNVSDKQPYFSHSWCPFA